MHQPLNTLVNPRWAVRLVIGFSLILGTAWIGTWVHVGQWLHSGGAATADRAISSWLYTHSAPGTLAAMTFVSAVHGIVGVALMTACIAAYLRWTRDPRWIRLLACVPLGMLLNVLVKLIIHRDRPTWAWQTGSLPESFSFPSGHTAAACLFYGFIGWWLAERVNSPLGRASLFAAAAAMVVLVAVSRIVLGVHYPSDCIGAIVEAMAWLAICLKPEPIAPTSRSR
jgi:membrane-associated phospholipid phosphatase